MTSFVKEAELSHDPIHGYIAYTGRQHVPDGETSEADIIQHPWVQRLRYIHQLQTAWWVFPTAEHTRFQHVLGAMHLASRSIDRLYDSLVHACRKQGQSVPSQGYVETLVRMAGLLHDVGHGPFGHFLDDHFLSPFGLTHETLGAQIIQSQLGSLLANLRQNPNSRMQESERLDPAQVAWLIQRPKSNAADEGPMWLRFLRSLLSGIYTIDNMDFVLRDAYMTGYSTMSFDMERLLHYSFFSEQGLTIHDRGLNALLRFMAARSELFRAVYFHREVRAIDLQLTDLFAESKDLLFAGNPAENLDAYLDFTEASLLVDVGRWQQSEDARVRSLGQQWHQLLRQQVVWRMVCQRNLVFGEQDSEAASIFSDPDSVERRVRQQLPPEAKDIALRVDIPRHIYRPHTRGPARNQNFLYNADRDEIRTLADNQLFRHLPISQRVCRVYAHDHQFAKLIASALDSLLGPNQLDDLTNM